MDFVEVAIIGGGPAGLTAAGALARQLHTAVVFDTQTYRNKNSTHMHMVPTWDHKDPKDFRAATKESILARYSTIQFLDIGVTSIEKKPIVTSFLSTRMRRNGAFERLSWLLA
ncbi:hypothetical protein BofuT4_P095660.1 [Botrytis cinerea T4]|uniref:FAD/NAD(P)-binding domain-containing protein n=1 Tax=Botryotinia fuckeliana (strain T4) TaxID=999810 RepID=G2YDL0_BOTF4|nr:hypothetical protein BofuT4_P095660.1 [Botrytis cinerea T4]